MRKILFLLATVFALAATAQKPQNLINAIGNAANTKNPSRKVIYTCPTNEEFYACEYFSNMKAKSDKFACMTINKNTQKLTFVLNGDPVISAKDLCVYWVDLSSKNKCIYSYSKGKEQEYLFIEGNTYGPYDYIGYYQYGRRIVGDGSVNLDLLYNRNSFHFISMGNPYRHDNDGSIYPCKPTERNTFFEANPVFRDKSGKHEAKFSNNFRTLTVDGRSYTLPIDAGCQIDNIYSSNFVITDKGVCVFNYGYYTPENYKSRYFLISNGKLTEFTYDEYYDPSSDSLKKRSEEWMHQYDEQFQSAINWDSDSESLVNGYSVSLRDKTNRHLFTSNWKYDYVVIDGKRFNTTAPIKASYDQGANAFVWVTIEGKQLVQYTYRL